MAAKADIPQAYKDMVKEQKIVTKFREFSDVTAPKEKKGKAPLTGTNSKKICADCWEKPSSSPFKSLKMGELVDASVFPKVTDKSKGGMEITVDKCAEYMARLSLKVVDKNKENEIGKTKDKAKADQLKAERKGLAFDTPEVIETAKTLCGCVTSPEITGTKQSATGNVGGLTDTSKYTGAHKERFDASGKGKGIDGRVDKADNSGYVGNYKEAGTFDKKHPAAKK